MANYIKYSTNAQTNALKIGNFWLGPINDGKGPTSTTGYYTSYNPVSGGFTIYLNKESNGPAIYRASNQSELVSITNKIAGTSYTTSAECLTYYVTQTDKFCVNREYEGIVTDGLVLNLDAGFTPSYPTSGTSWYDLSVGVNNGTLTNGPTFSSLNSGSIVLDGVDDYVGSFSNYSTYFNFTTSNQFTISCFFKVTTNANFKAMVVSGNNNDVWNYGLWVSDTNTLFTGYHNVSKYGNTTLNSGQIYQGTLTYSNNVHTLYLNGVNDGTFTNTGLFNATSQQLAIGRKGNTSTNYFPGSIYTTQIYNRALTSVEILQNYKAQKGRFGL